jgi:hypothetical protein
MLPVAGSRDHCVRARAVGMAEQEPIGAQPGRVGRETSRLQPSWPDGMITALGLATSGICSWPVPDRDVPATGSEDACVPRPKGRSLC